MNKGPEIRAFKMAPRFGQICIFIEEVGPTGLLAIAKPIVMDMEPIHKPFAADPPPTTTLSPTAAQQLIDDLWDCGLRPSEGSGSAGQLAAVERHLKDMQRLVFNGGCGKEKKVSR